MKHYLNLIPISANVSRKQSFMTRTCIVLAVFLVTVMFGLADLYLQGQIAEKTQAAGNWHYRFPSPPDEKNAFISERPEVAVSGLYGVASSDAGYRYRERAIGIGGQEKDVFERIFLGKLTEGSYPDADDEIAVSSEMKESYGLRLGDGFEITLPNGGSARYIITGFITDTRLLFPESEPGADPPGCAVLTTGGLHALETHSPGGSVERSYVIQFSRFCNMPERMKDIAARLGLSMEEVTANELLLSVLGQLSGNDTAQIYSVAWFLSLIVMLTCVLMISGSLNSNVAQRTKFFGMLRCLGATPKQLLRFVRFEGLYWCVTAIPTGLVAGIAADWLLSGLMKTISPARLSYMPAFGISWVSIAAGTLLGLCTVLLASRSPAKKASRVSPLEAVSGNAGPRSSARKAADTRRFKIETALGLHHALEHKKNFFLMTGAFAICITLFLCFSTIIDFMEHAMMPKPWTPDLSIVSPTGQDNAIPASSEPGGAGLIEQTLADEIGRSNEVKRVYGRMFAYDVPAEMEGERRNVNLISYEKHQFSWAAESLLEGSLAPVIQEKDQVLFVYNEAIPVHVSDRITLALDSGIRTVTVAGILKDTPLARDAGAETVICSEKTFTGLTGQTGYTILDVQFKGGAAEEDVTAVKNLFPDGTEFTEKLSQVREQRRFYYAFAVLAYGFLSIIAAITMFHIMNAVNMSAAAKWKQYGAMRAIGMSGPQLVKMIRAESAAYAAPGCVLGCMLGLLLHRTLFLSLITTFWGAPWSPPYEALGVIVSLALVTALLAVYGPAKRLLKLSAVESISAP